jgi:hypothetical protein
MKLIKFYYLLWRLFFLFYGEKFFKRLNYNWNNLPSRSEIVNYLIKKNNYKSYLEIGCNKNDLFLKVIIKNKVGVDPNEGGTIKLTSDHFFKVNKDTFDIIFIDGLHVYEQVKRDILNSVKILNKNGVILIHDCLPNKIWEQNIPRMNGAWSGDVWKSIIDLRRNKNLDIYTLIADRGIGVVLNRKNKNLLVLDTNVKKLKFSDYYLNHNRFMNLISFSDFKELSFE